MNVSQFDLDDRVPFEQIPGGLHVRAFGVDYARLADNHGGQLYLTKHGWPWRKSLDSSVWFADGRYHQEGQRLRGGTGTVYRLQVSGPGEPRVELVAKVSRFAEHVPIFMPSTLPPNLPPNLVDEAVFNSPFEEFGLIEDMRRSRFGPPELRILTKRPLAIYCSPRRYKLWQLGRTEGRFHGYDVALQADQEDVDEKDRVSLNIDRQYIMLFGWVRGVTAEELAISGELSQEEVKALSARVNQELYQKGFRILDNKPKHFILRRRPDGRLVRRNGKLSYVQIDFELLQRTEAYRRYITRYDPSIVLHEESR